MTESAAGVSSSFLAGGRRLFGFGIALVMIGTVPLFLALVIFLGLAMQRLGFGPFTNSPATGMTSAMVLLVCVGIGVVWTGIDSIRMRRWTRPVILSFAWMLLVAGILFVIVPTTVNLILPDQAPPANTALRTPAARRAANVAQFEQRFVFALSAVLMTIGPAAFLIAFNGKSTQAALDQADPTLGWTDRRPLPTLGLALGLSYVAFLSLMLGLTGSAPFFGVILQRELAQAAQLGWAIAWLGAAWLVYRMNSFGPWLALLLAALLATSIAFTFSAAMIADPRGARYAGNYDEFFAHAQMNLVRAITMVSGYALPAIAYILYVRHQTIRFITQTKVLNS